MPNEQEYPRSDPDDDVRSSEADCYSSDISESTAVESRIVRPLAAGMVGADSSTASDAEAPGQLASESVSEASVVVTTGAFPVPEAREHERALREFRLDLLDLISKSNPKDWKGEEEDLVARYVGLWSVLERADAQRYSAQALLGLRLLRTGEAKIAHRIFEEIQFQTSTQAALTYLMRGIGAFLVLFVLAGYLVFLISRVSDASDGALYRFSFSSSEGHVLIATVSGMLGSVVSLLLRLSEFESAGGRSQMFLKLTGATLPIVGGVFGAFIAALISTGIVNISVGDPSGQNVWLFAVIGFLSGFSERFSRGFIRIAEDRLGGGGEPGPRLSVPAGTVLASARSNAPGPAQAAQ